MTDLSKGCLNGCQNLYLKTPSPKKIEGFNYERASIASQLFHNQLKALSLMANRWAFEYGPICYLRFGQQKVVVISDARVAHELCVQQAENFSTRPRGLLLSFILRGKG